MAVPIVNNAPPKLGIPKWDSKMRPLIFYEDRLQPMEIEHGPAALKYARNPMDVAAQPGSLQAQHRHHSTLDASPLHSNPSPMLSNRHHAQSTLAQGGAQSLNQIENLHQGQVHVKMGDASNRVDQDRDLGYPRETDKNSIFVKN